MKLYVVTTSYDYESFRTFVGVFSTKEKAEEVARTFISDDTEILEVELDGLFDHNNN